MIIATVSPLHPHVPHPQIQPTMDWNSIFLIHSWESTHVEGWLYALFNAILYTGLQRPQILASSVVWNQFPSDTQGQLNSHVKDEQTEAQRSLSNLCKVMVLPTMEAITVRQTRVQRSVYYTLFSLCTGHEPLSRSFPSVGINGLMCKMKQM